MQDLKLQVVSNDPAFGFTLGLRLEDYIEMTEDESEAHNRTGLIIGFILFDVLISWPDQSSNNNGFMV